MPRIASAKKRLRQSRRANARNRPQRSTLRTAIKRVFAATTSKDAQEAYAAAEKMIDRAARKGLIHRNNAARHKSQLVRAVRAKG